MTENTTVSFGIKTEYYNELLKLCEATGETRSMILRDIVEKALGRKPTLHDGYLYMGEYRDNDGRIYKAWRPWVT